MKPPLGRTVLGRNVRFFQGDERWDRPGGMDRLSDFRLHRRGLAYLDRPDGTASLRISRRRQSEEKRLIGPAEGRTAKRDPWGGYHDPCPDRR